MNGKKSVTVSNKGNEGINKLHVLKTFSNYGALEFEKIGFYYDEFMNGKDWVFEVEEDKLELITNCFAIFKPKVKFEVQ